MEIIAHTASAEKDKNTLLKLKNHDLYSKIELDFIPTKDNIFVWSHSNIHNKMLINRSNYKSISDLLTLEEVLEILENSKPLVIEIKFARNIYNNINNYLKSLEILKNNNDISICSFNESLIKELLKCKNDLEI